MTCTAYLNIVEQVHAFSCLTAMVSFSTLPHCKHVQEWFKVVLVLKELLLMSWRQKQQHTFRSLVKVHALTGQSYFSNMRGSYTLLGRWFGGLNFIAAWYVFVSGWSRLSSKLIILLFFTWPILYFLPLK